MQEWLSFHSCWAATLNEEGLVPQVVTGNVRTQRRRQATLSDGKRGRPDYKLALVEWSHSRSGFSQVGKGDLPPVQRSVISRAVFRSFT
jgi:hypothetical protein